MYSWGAPECSWDVLGELRGALRKVGGGLGALLDRSWGAVERSCGTLGSSWDAPGELLGTRLGESASYENH